MNDIFRNVDRFEVWENHAKDCALILLFSYLPSMNIHS